MRRSLHVLVDDPPLLIELTMLLATPLDREIDAVRSSGNHR